MLIDRLPSLVLTSATLSIGGSFGYVRARLGVGEALEVRVPSEFDYRTQALVYLPRKMPDPRTREYAAAFAEEAAQLLTASEGRAFLLFTSYAALRDAHARLSTRLPYPMFVQGTMPRGVLIEQFRRTPNAVLFGTSSFWQGVDVVGEALSCVIIDRIPFASPGDPVVAARIEALQRRGIDAFAGFQVPLAILTLLQGVGRLIRHRQDRGVIALLDPRLQSMGYGRRFLNALPPAPVTRRPEDVAVLREVGALSGARRPDDRAADIDGSESRPTMFRMARPRRIPPSPGSSPATLLLAHLLTLGRYGIFRDEFYYLANGRHLAWGYVDHPPLVAAIAWLIEHTIGTSVYALRAPMLLALVGMLAVMAALARRIGGGGLAVTIAWLAFALSPYYLYTFHYLSMNAPEVLWWSLAALLLFDATDGHTAPGQGARRAGVAVAGLRRW